MATSAPPAPAPAPVARMSIHACSFPPDAHGSLQSCACGRTWSQHNASMQFDRAARLVASLNPLPPGGLLTGLAGGEWHAIERENAQWALERGGVTAPAVALCRRLAGVYRKRGAWTFEPWSGMPLCPDCSWAAAAAAGDLDAQLARITPEVADRAVLARRMPDPDIAVTACRAILDTALVERDEVGDRIIQLLAAVTRHAPQICLPEGCSDGGCDHYPPGYDPAAGGPFECTRPAALALCLTCTLTTGPWAGEWEGMTRAECLIDAPCQVLTALAASAAEGLARARAALERASAGAGSEESQ